MGMIEAPALFDDHPLVVRHRISAQNYYRMAETGTLPPVPGPDGIEVELTGVV
jgi:hypothetical protein